MQADRNVNISVKAIINRLHSLGEISQKIADSVLPNFYKASIKTKRRKIYLRRYHLRGERMKKRVKHWL